MNNFQRKYLASLRTSLEHTIAVREGLNKAVKGTTLCPLDCETILIVLNQHINSIRRTILIMEAAFDSEFAEEIGIRLHGQINREPGLLN